MISAQFKHKIRVFILGFLTTVTSTIHTSINSTYSLLSSSQFASPLPAVILDQVTPPAPSPKVIAKGCQVSPTFTPEVRAWEEDICRWSKEQDTDPDIIATLMQIESCGNNSAVSATGVRGLFQVTGANLGGLDPFDPNVSAIRGPGKVFKDSLVAANGDIRAAMAGYNGGGWARQYISGEMNRDQFIRSLRTHRLWNTQSKALAKVNEVERYAQWANIYFEAKENRIDTLDTWLNLGGYRLCNEAATDLGMTPRYSKPHPNSPVIASDSHTR